MALEPVILDDLTWSDMVLGIRRRIAAASDGKWTLHAPVDPGVTLLELFAWLLEQRVYWMEQVPDAFVRAALKLLGEEMRSAKSAATVLQFGSGAFDVVPALTATRLPRRQPSLIFSTEHALTLLPVGRIGLHIADRDRTADLEQGRVLRLFPSDGSEREVKIVLWLREVIPAATPGEPFALLFDLRTPSGIQPQWVPDALDEVQPPAQVSWRYRSAAKGSLAQFAQVNDGTGGFRRSGVVRLPLPHDWQAEGPAEGGLTPYALWVGVAKATFTAPPRLERIVPNVAIARHMRQTQEHALKRRWLPLPGNQLDLAELPEGKVEKDFPPLEATVKLQLLERGQRPKDGDGTWHEWEPVADLAFSDPGDRHFVVDREHGVVRFGDGLTGRIPLLAETPDVNVKVRYSVGGGSPGNLGDSLKWEGATKQDLEAKNVVPADGGAEPETIAEARERIASALRQRHRAITREDYEELALTTPGIALKRAHAAVGFHPGHPCTKVPGAVTIFVVPDAPREEVDDEWVENAFVAGPVADPGALEAVCRRLDLARLVTSEVFVRNPLYRPIALTVTVEGDPGDPSTLREQIKKRLQNFVDPLVGDDQEQGWPFGEPLRPSVLLREAQRALGETGEVVSVSIKLLDTDAAAEDCSDVRIGEHALVTLHEVNVQLRRSTANRPRQGGLR
jgi:hypothetical protein